MTMAPILKLYILMLFVTTMWNVQCLTKRKGRPPSLVSKMKRIYYFKGDETSEKIVLPCTAVAEPKAEYRWEKDDRKLDVSSSDHMLLLPGIGSLAINDPTDRDEGYYQCFATNSYGTSVSVLAHVQKAVIDTFPKVTEPKRNTPTVGDSLTLKCHVPKSIPSSVNIMWAKAKSGSTDDDLHVLMDDERVTRDLDGNLHFTNVRMSDRTPSGTVYMCMVLNKQLRSMVQGDDQTIEPQATVGENRIPVDIMWTSPTEIIALREKSLTIKCIFSGNPTPKVGWNRKGKDATLFENIKIQSFGQELFIETVSFKDAGEYECHGVNDENVGKVTQKFTVKVEASPYWIDKPKNVVVGVEEDAVFKCNVGGDPDPEIKWYINGVRVEEVPDNLRRRVYTRRIAYKNVTQSDQQVIQCNATNKHGYLWADVFLNVLAQKPEIAPNVRKDLKIAEGMPLEILCNATGKPTPKITWYKGDQILAGQYFKKSDDGSLNLKRVTMADKGSYKCKATNRYGFAELSTSVIVRLKTEILSKTPDGVKIAGNNIILKCNAKTDPNEGWNLKVQWLYQGLALRPNSSRHVVDENLSLKILDSRASDSGYYTCNISNGVDSAQGTIKVMVKDKPERPIKVVVEKCHKHAAVVRWEAASDNNSPITKYIIQYCTNFKKGSWILANKAVSSARKTSVILSPWANYTFRVMAENAIGLSDPSAVTSVCSSGPAIPEKQPANVQTPTHKKNMLVIKWDEMVWMDHNGPGYRYFVTVRRRGSPEVKNYTITDYKTPSIEIPVRTVHEPYDVTVESINDVGRCLKPVKTVVGYSGEAEPNLVPQNFRLDPSRNVTSTSATFLWSALDHTSSHMFGVFRGYQIQFWKTGNKETFTVVDVPVSRRKRRAVIQTERHTISSFPPFSNLTTQVVVRNTHYSGPPSNPVFFYTLEGVPSRVSYLTARIRGANHFVINWGEPKHHNGILTGYEICYQKINENSIGRKSSVIHVNSSAEKHLLLDGLLNNQQYRIYIWAKTRIGRSKVYYIDVITGSGGVPAKPEFTFSSVAERDFNVTWHKVTESGLTIGYYHLVKYRRLGDFVWSQTEKETTRLWKVVKNLIPGTTYEVRVEATTAEGSFPSKSLIRKVTTLTAAHVRQSVASATWFIGMMVTLALLLLILIIVCIAKRNRGDKYHVQEKERLRGNDFDNGNLDFSPYHDNDDNSIGKKSGHSDDHPHITGDGSEADSMEEYAGVDPSKFNEDGSFIGQYRDKMPTSETNVRQPMSTFM